jgi:multicomponent Na+:H+ antiporter subunit D
VNTLLPLTVAIPLLTAAFVVGTVHLLPRRAHDVLAIGATASVCALGFVLLFRTERADVIEWFGGWRPRGGVAIGVDFAADPFAAGMVALAGGLVLLALVYSWSYVTEAGGFVDALVLVCCGAMCGFALSGDLFNLFVWLELMGVSAYALTGFEVRQIGPLQGAVNFAITNTVGGFFVLIGIALLYARTGALNLAQVGTTLAGQPKGGLAIVALTLIVCGFFCKAAVVPFHFWLGDAYAVAPAPACAIFAGVMTDIGLFGIARVYWTVFAGQFGLHERAVGDALLWLGVATALVGGTMAFLQRHLKRMLADSVVCHIGIMLAGIGLFSTKGLAGAANVLVAHGLLTAGLFLTVGVLVAWLRSVDELHLFARGRDKPWLGVLWGAAAVGLVGPPYVGLFVGHSLIDDAASAGHREWLPPLLWLAGALASAALLRAGARIFLGLGVEDDPLLSPEMEEQPPRRGSHLTPLTVAAGVAIAAGFFIGLFPGLEDRTVAAAARFRDHAAYAAIVLHGRPALAHAGGLPFSLPRPAALSLVESTAALVLAIALATFGAFRRVPSLLEPPIAVLKAVHSGVIGDYVTWLTVGTAVIGGVWAMTLR